MWALRAADYFLYTDLGAATERAPHRHFALQLSLARDARMTAMGGGDTFRGLAGFLVGSNVVHDQHGEALQLFFDPLQGRGRRLLPLVRTRGVLPVPAELVRAFWGDCPPWPWRTPPPAQALEPAMDALIDALLAEHPSRPMPPLDDRVVRVIECLCASLQRRVPLSELAAMVELSPSRLSHLFKTEVGMPIRSYVVWLRVLAVLSRMHEGEQLTSLALCEGFADQPAFTRAYREMWGRRPSWFQHTVQVSERDN